MLDAGTAADCVGLGGCTAADCVGLGGCTAADCVGLAGGCTAADCVGLAGGVPGERFDSADVVHKPWGTARFERLDAQRMRLSWDATAAGFDDGELLLQRLTRPLTAPCQ